VEAELLEALTLLTNLAVSGRLPLPLQPFLCGGRLVPVLKKDNGIRPIVVGELLRSLIAKVALAELGDGLADLQPLQVGVGGQGPWAQAAVLTVREWTKALRGGSPNVLVKVDIANAFNSINRSTCLQGIRSLAPGLSSWSTWCLSQQTHVCWDGVTIPCTTGVQQGDPCAPALFSAGIHGALEDIAHRYPVIRQVWYLDDDALFGPPLRGLRLNRSKCELYRGPAADAKQIESLLPHPEDFDSWCYLGVPVAETTSLSSATVIARFDAMITGVTTLNQRFRHKRYSC